MVQVLVVDRRRGLRVEMEARGRATLITVRCTQWGKGQRDRAGESFAAFAMALWERLDTMPRGEEPRHRT